MYFARYIAVAQGSTLGFFLIVKPDDLKKMHF